MIGLIFLSIIYHDLLESAHAANSATDEQLAINAEISLNAQALTYLADALQDQVSHYKI